MKQVDILISKNHALQILYLKHYNNEHKTSQIIMDKKLKIHEKLNLRNEQTYLIVDSISCDSAG